MAHQSYFGNAHRRVSPTLKLLHEMNQVGEITFDGLIVTKPQLEQDLVVAIDLCLSRLPAPFVAMENRSGKWNIFSNERLIYALLKFMSDELPYPPNGGMEEFSGNLFSELPRLSQRNLREFQTEAVIFEESILDEDKKPMLRNFISKLKSML